MEMEGFTGLWRQEKPILDATVVAGESMLEESVRSLGRQWVFGGLKNRRVI